MLREEGARCHGPLALLSSVDFTLLYPLDPGILLISRSDTVVFRFVLEESVALLYLKTSFNFMHCVVVVWRSGNMRYFFGVIEIREWMVLRGRLSSLEGMRA